MDQLNDVEEQTSYLKNQQNLKIAKGYGPQETWSLWLRRVKLLSTKLIKMNYDHRSCQGDTLHVFTMSWMEEQKESKLVIMISC